LHPHEEMFDLTHASQVFVIISPPAPATSPRPTTNPLLRRPPASTNQRQPAAQRKKAKARRFGDRISAGERNVVPESLTNVAAGGVGEESEPVKRKRSGATVVVAQTIRDCKVGHPSHFENQVAADVAVVNGPLDGGIQGNWNRSLVIPVVMVR